MARCLFLGIHPSSAKQVVIWNMHEDNFSSLEKKDAAPLRISSATEEYDHKNKLKTDKESWQQGTPDYGAAKMKEDEVASTLKGWDVKNKEPHEFLPLGVGKKLNISTQDGKRETNVNPYTKRQNAKVVNDPVHGHIKLVPLCVAIMDTPQFQRLRYLKQMGTCDFVYPAAVHTRFEHSLGVYHLAGLLITSLRERQPELNITDEDVLCVQIAGLCNDLGHGPFSQTFDTIFIPSAARNKRWRHEQASAAMFEYMYKDPANNLASKFEAHGLDETDRIFIKEQIAGPLGEDNSAWPYDGRPQEKAFLYDIVANRKNGIDVVKWDSIRRDCLHLGMESNFDHLRLINFARVISVDDSKETQICLRDKEAFGIYQMYFINYSVQKTAYKHRVTSATSLMIGDALKEANGVIKMPKTDGTMVMMSECIKKNNMDAYLNLTDEVIRQILLNPDPRLEKARQLVRDVWRRKLYMFVVESPPIQGRRFTHEQEDEIRDGILNVLKQNKNSVLRKEHVIIELVNFSFGITDKNPMENIYFYSKANPAFGKRKSAEEITYLMPKTSEEQLIRVFLKPSESDADGDIKKCQNLWEAFQEWSKEKLQKGDEQLHSPT